jgi:hypothetical protein
MKNKQQILYIFIIALLLSSCQNVWEHELPNSGIVFETGTYEENLIGFAQADGSDLSLITIKAFMRKPTFSADGKIIFGLVGDFRPLDSGYPAYWNPKGTYHVCRKGVFNQFFNHIDSYDDAEIPYRALVGDFYHIWLVDLKKCDRVMVLIDLETTKRADQLKGFSYNPNSQTLAYGVSVLDQYGDKEVAYEIRTVDLKNHEETLLLDGFNPSYSPDGSMLAYFKQDGMYIANLENLDNVKVLDHSIYDPNLGTSDDTPIPRWSPDQNYLLYHRCESYTCAYGEGGIYLLNTQNLQEKRIFNFGLYPNWMP